jgi:hypothetical protein
MKKNVNDAIKSTIMHQNLDTGDRKIKGGSTRTLEDFKKHGTLPM